MKYGDEEKAIQTAEKNHRKCLNDGKEKPSEMYPACLVYRLVKEIRKKINR